MTNVLSGRATTTTTAVRGCPISWSRTQGFDLIAVVMGKYHVVDLLPAIAANHPSPSILSLHNNTAGPQALARRSWKGVRMMLGVAGASGRRNLLLLMVNTVRNGLVNTLSQDA